MTGDYSVNLLTSSDFVLILQPGVHFKDRYFTEKYNSQFLKYQSKIFRVKFDVSIENLQIFVTLPCLEVNFSITHFKRCPSPVVNEIIA